MPEFWYTQAATWITTNTTPSVNCIWGIADDISLALIPFAKKPMHEAEWLTRKLRIDKRLQALNPKWQIIPSWQHRKA
jgi:hypothetical protein